MNKYKRDYQPYDLNNHSDTANQFRELYDDMTDQEGGFFAEWFGMSKSEGSSESGGAKLNKVLKRNKNKEGYKIYFINENLFDATTISALIKGIKMIKPIYTREELYAFINKNTNTIKFNSKLFSESYYTTLESENLFKLTYGELKNKGYEIMTINPITTEKLYKDVDLIIKKLNALGEGNHIMLKIIDGKIIEIYKTKNSKKKESPKHKSPKHKSPKHKSPKQPPPIKHSMSLSHLSPLTSSTTGKSLSSPTQKKSLPNLPQKKPITHNMKLLPSKPQITLIKQSTMKPVPRGGPAKVLISHKKSSDIHPLNISKSSDKLKEISPQLDLLNEIKKGKTLRASTTIQNTQKQNIFSNLNLPPQNIPVNFSSKTLLDAHMDTISEEEKVHIQNIFSQIQKYPDNQEIILKQSSQKIDIPLLYNYIYWYEHDQLNHSMASTFFSKLSEQHKGNIRTYNPQIDIWGGSKKRNYIKYRTRNLKFENI